MASFDDTFSNDGEETRTTSGPFDDDYVAYESYSSFDAAADGDAPPPTDFDFAAAADEVTVEHTSHSFDVNNNNPRSLETYGFGSSPNPDYSPSPFESSVHESNGNGKPFDIGADTEGIFTSSDGPLLPEPNEMREEGAAYREWRRPCLQDGKALPDVVNLLVPLMDFFLQCFRKDIKAFFPRDRNPILCWFWKQRHR